MRHSCDCHISLSCSAQVCLRRIANPPERCNLAIVPAGPKEKQDYAASRLSAQQLIKIPHPRDTDEVFGYALNRKSELTIGAVELDQGLGGSVLSGQGLVILGDGRGDLLGELLAQLDAPLIVGIQTPHGALDEGDVLVQGDQLTDRERGQSHAEDGGGRTVAGEHAGRNDLFRSALGADFLGGLAEGQRLGLGEVVAQEQLMHVLIAVLDCR